MNKRERLLAAVRRQPTDRVPIAPIFNIEWLREHCDPDRDLVGAQLWASALHDFDSFIYLRQDDELGGWQHYNRWWVLHDWTAIECPTWHVSQQILAWSARGAAAWNLKGSPHGARTDEFGSEGDTCLVRHTIETPVGCLSTLIEYDEYTYWFREPVLKDPADAELLSYRPDPSSLPIASTLSRQIERIGANGVGIILVPGVWHQACDFRGSAELMYDVFDRPQWVRKFLRMLRDWLTECVKQLGRSGMQAIVLNESHVGLGLSPSIFRDFVLPGDRAIVEAMHDAGLLVLYHICGRSNALLELMVETGADAIETLTPGLAGGDVDLADAKARVGHKVCIRGGLNQHSLVGATGDEIREEVWRCLDAAAGGGGYILAPSGYFAKEIGLEAVATLYDAARTHPAGCA